MTIKGCGKLAETKDVILPSRDSYGPSWPLENECGSPFFIDRKRGIRLCKNCCVKHGFEW